MADPRVVTCPSQGLPAAQGWKRLGSLGERKTGELVLPFPGPVSPPSRQPPRREGKLSLLPWASPAQGSTPHASRCFPRLSRCVSVSEDTEAKPGFTKIAVCGGGPIGQGRRHLRGAHGASSLGAQPRRELLVGSLLTCCKEGLIRGDRPCTCPSAVISSTQRSRFQQGGSCPAAARTAAPRTYTSSIVDPAQAPHMQHGSRLPGQDPRRPCPFDPRVPPPPPLPLRLMSSWIATSRYFHSSLPPLGSG